VTANYVDGTSETVTGYELFGTLTVGTSTVTVSYGGKTDPFTVSVTSIPYSLESGTHTFSTTGETITVSNGNHIKLDYASANNTYGTTINISDLLKNGSSALQADNASAINNLSDVMFTIPANAEVAWTIENITKTKGETTTGDKGQLLVGIRKTEESTGAITGVGYVKSAADRLSVTETITVETDCSCVFLYLERTRSNISVEFDVLLTVNGARWI
jgi:hypothetical protein